MAFVSLVSNSCRRMDCSKSVSSSDSLRVVEASSPLLSLALGNSLEESYASSQLSGGFALASAMVDVGGGASVVGDCVVGGEGGLVRFKGNVGGSLE